MLGRSTGEYLLRPATIGAVGSGIAAILDPSAPAINLFGMSVPAPVGFGLMSAASAEIAEVARNMILPEVPFLKRFSRTESAIMIPLLSGLSYWGLFKFTQDAERGNVPDLNVFGIGAGSALLGDWVYENVVKPNAISQKKHRRRLEQEF